MLRSMRATKLDEASTSCRAEQSGPLSLPLELIEIILDQALPSPSYESPSKNPRIVFLLSLALVCRHLRAWAEQRLLDGPLTADGPADMDRLSRWLNARPGRMRRARDVALVLQTGAEPSEAAQGRVSRQEKALKRLLSLILQIEKLRVECRVQSTSLWGSDLFNGLQHLHTLELIGVKFQHERPEPSRRSRLILTFRPDQPPPLVALCLRRLILCVTTFPGIIIPHQITHLSLLSHANVTPWTETLPCLVGLRYLDLGGKPSVNARGMLLQLHHHPHLIALGLPFTEVNHHLLLTLPSSVRYLRLHSPHVQIFTDYAATFALLQEALLRENHLLDGLERIYFGVRGTESLGYRVEAKQRFDEVARSRGVEIVYEERRPGESALEIESEGASRFRALGETL